MLHCCFRKIQTRFPRCERCKRIKIFFSKNEYNEFNTTMANPGFSSFNRNVFTFFCALDVVCRNPRIPIVFAVDFSVTVSMQPFRYVFANPCEFSCEISARLRKVPKYCQKRSDDRTGSLNEPQINKLIKFGRKKNWKLNHFTCLRLA